MKKITYLWALALALITGGGMDAQAQAQAQSMLTDKVTDGSAITEGGKYVFKNVADATARRGWMYEDTANSDLRINTTVDAYAINSIVPDNYIFEAVATGEAGSWYFKNVSTGKYLLDKPSSSVQTVDEANKKKVQITAKPGSEAGIFNIYVPGAGSGSFAKYLNVNAGGWTALWNAEGDANGKWEVYETALAPAIATLNVTSKLDGTDISKTTSTTYPVVEGKTVTISAPTYYGATVSGTSTYTLTSDEVQNVTFNYTVSDGYAFLADLTSTSLDEAKWVAFNLPSSGGGAQYYGIYDTAGNGTTAKRYTSAAGFLDGGVTLWAFVGNVFDGYKLYNKSNPTTPLSAGTQQGGGKPVITEGADGAVWNINVPTAGEEKVTVCLAGTNLWLNQLGGANTANLGYYSGGSPISLQLAPAFAQKYFPTVVKKEDYSGDPKGMGAQAIADAINAYNAYNVSADAWTTEAQNGWTDALKALFDADPTAVYNAAIAAITPDTGKYYRLKNAGRSGKELSIGDKDGATQAFGHDASDADVNAIWQFVKVEGEDTYKLLNVNTGKYLEPFTTEGTGGTNGFNILKDYTNGAALHFSYLGSGVYNIIDGNDKTMHMAGAFNICQWGDTNPTSASAWSIIEADGIDVTLNAAGGAAYATAYLPFAISGVSGAKAYTGAYDAESSTLKMTEAAAVPAQTGFVLVGESAADKAALTFGNAAEGVTSDLTGSLTAVTLADDTRAGYLVLGLADNEIGFYTPATSVTAIPANRAYLLSSQLNGAQAVRLDFDGVLAGINGAITGDAAAKAPVYDLAGRRVIKTVKGGLYIQGGKKFIAR